MTMQGERIACLRARAGRLDVSAEAARRLAGDLHGRGRHAAGFAVERRAERREARAAALREEAAGVQAALELRAALAGVAAGL